MRGGFLAVLILLGLLNGSGPAGGSALAEGRAADCVSWVCSRGWLVCLVIGVGNTPVMLLLPACVGSVAWWVPLRACVRVGVACCRGSGVVRPGCLACGSASLLWGGVVGVGGLVVNCIVDASIITVLFL